MRYINLTRHSIDVLPPSAFQGLEQINQTTWVAESCDTAQAVAVFPSEGVARIPMCTGDLGLDYLSIPIVVTVYGDAIGIPDCCDDDILIVSLRTQSMMRASGHPRADQAVSPYGVVRDVKNGSIVLGCMGLNKEATELFVPSDYSYVAEGYISPLNLPSNR